jgi:tetratricopeptide (TPR) repeat protein
MRGFALMLCVVAGLSGAQADQTDPALDALFDQLSQRDLDAGEARSLQNRIWTIWMRYDGEVDGVEALMRQGNAATNSGDLHLAWALFSQAIRMDPAFAEAWNRRATVNYLTGSYEQSLSDIEEVLTREPRHFGALSGRGLVLLELGDLEGALDAFEAALDVNPYMSGPAANAEAIRERLEGEPI